MLGEDPAARSHRVERREVGKKSDLGRIRTCICWFKSVAPTPRATATGSNAGNRKTTLAGLEPAILVKIQTSVAATQAFLLRFNNDWWQLLVFVASSPVFSNAFKLGTGPSSSPPNYFPLPSDKDTLAERLRRRPAKPMGSPRVGSNPTGVVFRDMPKKEKHRELNLRKKACVAATAQLVP